MLRRIANQLSTQPTNRRTHGDGAPQVFVYPHQPRVHRRTAGLASRWRQTVAFGDDKQLRLKRLRHSDLETAKAPTRQKGEGSCRTEVYLLASKSAWKFANSCSHDKQCHTVVGLESDATALSVCLCPSTHGSYICLAFRLEGLYRPCVFITHAPTLIVPETHHKPPRNAKSPHPEG